jgi:O-antigen ligase
VTVRYFLIFCIVSIQPSLRGTKGSLLLTLLLLFLLFFWNLNIELRQKLISSKKPILVLCLLFFISYVRGLVGGSINITTFFISLFTLVLSIRMLIDDFEKAGFLNAVFRGLALVVVLNLVFFAFGVQGFKLNNINLEVETNVRVLEIFGVGLSRVKFLFSPNYAYYAMILGVLIIFREYVGKYKKLILIVSVVSLLLNDARGPILYLIISFLFSRAKWSSRSFVFYTSLFLIIPLPIILDFLSNNYLDPEEVSNASSFRSLIWLSFLLNYNPSPSDFLFGYGYVGQMLSEISYYYKYLFSSWENGEKISLHNAYLQYMVDYGLVGLICLFYIIRQIFISWEKDKIAVWFLTYIVMLGSTDLTIQPNNMLLLLLFFGIYLGYNKRINIEREIDESL